jgi:hypothetical protein
MSLLRTKKPFHIVLQDDGPIEVTRVSSDDLAVILSNSSFELELSPSEAEDLLRCAWARLVGPGAHR